MIENEEELAKRLTSPENLQQVEAQIKQDLQQQMSQRQPLNRKQRRALKKKAGKAGREQLSAITNTAEKLNYIDLIQKLQELNAKKEKENDTSINENN